MPIEIKELIVKGTVDELIGIKDNETAKYLKK